MLTNAEAQQALREEEYPQDRQTHKDAAERDLFHRLADIGGIEGRRQQPREGSIGGGGLQEVGEERREEAPEHRAALRHIVEREIVVRAEIRRRAEACVIVRHDAERNDHVRQD